MKKRLEHMDEHEYELQRDDYYEDPIENIHLAGFPRLIEMEILLEFKHEGHLQDFPSFEWWKERRDNASRVGVKFHPLGFCETSRSPRTEWSEWHRYANLKLHFPSPVILDLSNQLFL
jgi:hypothetical protein